ncbi:B12-binding domain-containing radical SAM protein [Paenibacillus alkalitolerans]|uniref:B12-binding domain-containing radical SAM protein n=1 Tax=Paenibacillus alkalitolerans TaxID=2799335 RepID=UPI0018F53E9B|nr:B12-binding domain-containing radical SAM protein [Paenibacillus alkalitolerans]
MKTVLATLNAKYIHMSLALRYLKAFSGSRFDIDIAEYTIKDPALNVVTDLFRRAPDIVGFSCYIWNIEETIPIIRMLKKIRPDIRIVLGGPEVSYDTEYWMERIPEVDFIVVGEGEETFDHLLRELSPDGARKYHLVFGLAYRGKEGAIVVNPGRPKLALDDIPSPHYFPGDTESLPKRVVYFETSRGCPFSCQFCLSSIEVGVRYFNIERTKRDLLHLIRSGAKLIKFVDRTFNIKRDYAMEVFEFLIANHGGCTFQFEITADIMRPEVLDYLAEHAPPGVFRFEIGVQSTNDETNEIIQRRQNFAKLSRTVTKIKESGKIAQHLDLIAGLPEEDYASFRKTFNDVFALGPEELQLGFLKMLRGTGVRARAADHGYVYTDRAPYEILGNNVLSFSDIVRIKQAEDVLEKYWNAHRMDRTVRYLIDRQFESAFDFFQQFGTFWEERGWERIGHQLEDLFLRLREFLLHRRINDFDAAEGLMKYDYFTQHKYKPRKIWWNVLLSEEEHSHWMRRLSECPEDVSPEFAALGLSERELHKQVMIEKVPLDLRKLLASGQADRSGETLLIARFSPDSSAYADVFTMPMERAVVG